jgi:5-methylcytosine-specific restriction endonuclease McrA
MKTYILDSNTQGEHPSLKKWLASDFYNRSVVLGIDIGLEGIGVYLRKGREELFAKTFLFDVPETGRLEARRQKRAWRHARKNRATRQKRLKALMERYGLPWVSDEVLSKTDPFHLRHRAITGGIGSAEALSICIRHLVDHRGFDYFAFAEEGAFPWGDSDSAKEAVKWISGNFIDAETENIVLDAAAPLDWSDDEATLVRRTLAERKDFCADNGIEQVLAAYAREKKSNLRKAARRNNFPRAMVEAHLRDIITRHAHLMKDAAGFTEALFIKPKNRREKEAAIFHYNRKTREEAKVVWERRINRCPYAVDLGLGNPRVSPESDPSVGAWKALEFLSTRRVEVAGKDGVKLIHRILPETIMTLVSVARSNRELFLAKSKMPLFKEAKDLIQKEITALHGKGIKPVASKDSSFNESFFTQLQDIVRPSAANLRGNSSMSAVAAEKLFVIATKGGTNFDPEAIRERLNAEEFYNKRRTILSTHIGLYPQVEYLLGKRKREAGGFRQVARGRLHRLFEEIAGKLEGKTAPDFCVVEVIRDAPRNQKQKGEILKLQKARRVDREALFKSHGIADTGSGSARRRIALHSQQNGICPFTGKPLPSPLDPSLEIEHLFPASRGGLSSDENLVLTFREVNGQKGERTPREAASSNLPGWLTWDLMQKLNAAMRWGGRKRDIFAFEPQEGSNVPDFGNVTRTSQLARQLVRELAAWMGIEGDPESERERIGTPSGWVAAQARKSWLEEEGYTKVRSSLVHHLVDAAIISHIPPAAGLNHVRFGGIFFENESRKTRALPDLGPRITHWLGDETVNCPVEKLRSNSRTRSLGDATFWKILPADEKGRQKTRQRTKLDHNDYQDGISLDAELRRMGIPMDKIPPVKALDAWLDQMKEGSEESLKLLDGTPVRNVHKFDSKGDFTIPLGWSGRRTDTGSLHGARLLDGKFDRFELWLGWNSRKRIWEYYRRLIPTKTALRHLEQTLPGWWKKNKKTVCGSLPPFARKVAHIRKGDTFLLPLGREGKLDLEAPYVRWWFEVVSIRADGVITMKSSSYKKVEGTLMEQAGARTLVQTPSSPAVVAKILTLADAEFLAQNRGSSLSCD